MIISALTAAPAEAQRPTVLHRLEDEIEFDGAPDESAWRTVPQLPMTMSGPLYGADPSHATDVRVAYDDRFLYVAGRFGIPEGETAKSRSLTRDRWGDGDRFEVVVDGYNDNENGTGFATNPAGIRIDFSISGDAEGGSALSPAINRAWDAPWSVETTRNPSEWTVEMRIPLSTLRFQSGPDDRVVMGLIVRRYVADRNEHVTFPAIPERWAGGYQKPSLGRDVVLEGIHSSRPVYMTPYALAGRNRSYKTTLPDGPGYLRESEREVGLDVKFAIADNLILDLTANTDFAQAEVQDFQVNLTRFNLFYPEKRSFFLERAGVFDFQTRGDDRLFHSRRIGLGPDGRTVRILGGARLVGRVGDWDVGVLDMQTATSSQLPSENFGVARVRRRVLNSNSYAGAIFTSRSPRGEAARLAYGADGSFHLGGSSYLSGSVAQSYDGANAGLGSSAGVVSLERRSRVGLGFAQTLAWTGADYTPPVGFVGRAGIILHETNTNYIFEADHGSRLQRSGPGLETILVARSHDRTLESVEVAPGWNFLWKSGLRMSLEANLHMEDVRESFTLGNTTIPASRYWYRSARVFAALPTTWTFNSRFYFRYGQFYDGIWTLLIVNPYFQPSEHLQVGLDVQRTDARFEDRAPFRADIVRLRTEVALTRSLSGAAFVQYSSTSKTAAINARLRYNFGEGRDLFIVYDEQLNVPSTGPTTAPLSNRRGVLIKMTYTLPIS